MLRRQRRARLETDLRLAAYVTDRLSEGWTPEQIAGRLGSGSRAGLCADLHGDDLHGLDLPSRPEDGAALALPNHGAPVAASATVGRRATRSPRKPTFLSGLTTPTRARRWGTGRPTS